MASGAAELKQVAAAFERAGQGDAVARGARPKSPRPIPSDLEVRAGLALAYVAAATWTRRAPTCRPRPRATDPALWITLGEMELTAGRTAEGRAAIAQALTLDRNQAQAAVVVGCRLAESNPEAGYQCIEAVADAALAEGDYAAAAVSLHEFTIRVPTHLVALMRLVEICVDGGLEATMYEAQAQLADAYLNVGRGLEARIISEDLVAREPWNRANLDRFRRALVMLGEGDPDAIIADRLSGDSPFLATEKLDLNEGVSFDTPPPARRTGACAGRRDRADGREDAASAESGAIEIDLTDALVDDETPAAVGAAAAAVARPGVPRPARRVEPPVVRRGRGGTVPAGPHVSRDGHGRRRDQGARGGGAFAAAAVRCGVDARPALPRTQGPGARDRVAGAGRRGAGADRRRRPGAAVRPGPDARSRWARVRARWPCSSNSNPSPAAIATSSGHIDRLSKVQARG